MKIVRLFEDHMLDVELKTLKELGIEANFEVRPSFTEEEVIANAQGADVLITIYEPLTRRVLEQLPHLKLVLYRSIGFNDIDMAAATDLGIAVSHISRYCTDEVANYVLAAILMHNRRLHDFNQSVKVDGKWDYELFPDMKRLSSQTVGLIGFGNIPRLIAERLTVFGPKILAYDPFVPDQVLRDLGVVPASLEDIFKTADYISSHLPLNDATREVLNADLFSLSQHKPVFINSSRGGVVKEADLAAALISGHLSYAILDVLSSEDPDLSAVPFMDMDNVILTPHIAFYSQEAFVQGAQDNLKNLAHFLKGELDQAEIVNLKAIQ